MTARLAPDYGEPLGNAVPAYRKVHHITVGPATTNDVVIGDTATYALLSLQGPAIIYHVYTQVEVAFTSSVTLDIGDTGSLTRFISDTTMAPASSGAVLVQDTGIGSVPYVYSAAQDITVDVNGATVAAGVLHVYIDYAILQD